VPHQTCRHAVCKTFGQTEITDFGEGGDNLLLGGIHHRHLVMCGHAGIYVTPISEPGFSFDRGDGGGAGARSGSGTLRHGRRDSTRLSGTFGAAKRRGNEKNLRHDHKRF
jgi:hypothetical protein